MFDNKKATPENDPLQGKFDGMDRELRAPAALKQAAKTGVPLRTGKREGTAVHVRRFGKAIVAYALGVMLFLGVIAVLPGLWESEPISSPGTNVTTTDALADGTDSSVPPENSDSADVTDTPPIDQTLDSGDDSDKVTGSWIAMNLSRSSIKEFMEFYTVFQRKNTAPIVVTDLGNLPNSIVRYKFYGGIINMDTFPEDYDYDYSSGGPFVSGEQPIPLQFWYTFYSNCNDSISGTYDYAIVAENYILDNDIVVDLDDVRLERVSNGMETIYAKSELRNKKGEIRYYEIYSGEHRLMKFAICAVASTEDSYYDAICEQVVGGLVKLGY